MYFPLFVGVLCLSLFLLCITFCTFLFCNRLDEEEGDDYFAFNVFSMSCYCECSLALPHGAVGWSAVCDCGIS